jgi:hypothetical protein
MGYNPLRRYRGTKVVDITLLLVVSGVIVALVIWAST